MERSFLGRRVPPGFDVRTVCLAPGGVHAFCERDWRGAVVGVERGALELELRDGARHPIAGGSVLWLSGLGLRALHNPGPEQLVLVAVTRRDEFRDGSPSQ